jgi:hypothetical protein
VACHTHSHYRLKHGTSRGLAVDAERNRAAFEGALHLGRLLDECHRAGLAVRSVRSVSEELVPGWTPGQPDQPGRVG